MAKLALSDVCGLQIQIIQNLSGDNGAEWAAVYNAVNRGEVPERFAPGKDGFRTLGRVTLRSNDLEAVEDDVFKRLATDQFVERPDIAEELLRNTADDRLLDRTNFGIVEATLEDLGVSSLCSRALLIAKANARGLKPLPLAVALKFVLAPVNRTPRGKLNVVAAIRNSGGQVRYETLQMNTKETDISPPNVEQPSTVNFWVGNYDPGDVSKMRFLWMRQ